MGFFFFPELLNKEQLIVGKLAEAAVMAARGIFDFIAMGK